MICVPREKHQSEVLFSLQAARAARGRRVLPADQVFPAAADPREGEVLPAAGR